MKFKETFAIITTLFIALQPITYAGATTSGNGNAAKGITSKELDLNSLNETITSETYVVIDSNSGEVLLSKDENKKMYPASLTKIVTSLLLVESDMLDESFTVSKEADDIGEASMYAEEGEVLSGEDLLHAMMMQSANDACFVVAEGIGKTAENFYKMMTDRAKKLGAVNSNFTSSNGLHEDDHYTTAFDLALITKEALKNDDFRKTINTKNYNLTRTAENTMVSLKNKNKMLFEDRPEYNEYVIGGKTAYTSKAGNCLMIVAKKGDTEIIVVVMNSSATYEDTNKLINFTFDNFEYASIYEGGDFTYDYKGDMLNLYTKDSIGITTFLGKDLGENVKTEVKMLELPKEVEKNSKVGTVETYINNELYKSIDIYSKEAYTLSKGAVFIFFRNIVIFIGALILIKISINIYKMRKAKTKGYLKNSNFY